MRRVGSPAGILATAIILLTFGVFRSALAAAPASPAPEPTFTASQVSDATSALSAAILVDHQQSILPDGFDAGELSTEQFRQLDARIVGAYTTHFSGEALSRRLGNLRSWATDIMTRPLPRTLSSRLDRLDVASADVSAGGLVLAATYVIYQVTAQGDTGTDELIWGGWVTNSVTAQMILVGDRWTIASYTEQQTDSRNDPSVQKGWTTG